MIEEIGIAITVHERPALARQLIESVHRFYPAAHIYVCDDSRERTRYDAASGEGAVTNVHPGAYDIGVSAKRNVLATACEEALFFMCEEDFVFTKHTDLSLFYDALYALDVGLVGAPCCRGLDGHRWPSIGVRRNWFCGRSVLDGPVQLLRPPNALQSVEVSGRTIRYHRADFVPNFFLARTESLKACPWDEDLKTNGEHIEHMTRWAAIREASGDGGPNAEQYQARFRGRPQADDGMTEVYALATLRNAKHFAGRDGQLLRRGQRARVPDSYAKELVARGHAVAGMQGGALPMPVTRTDAPMRMALIIDTTCAHDRQRSTAYQRQRGRSHQDLQKQKMGIFQRIWEEPAWQRYPGREPDWDDPTTHAH